MKTSIQIGLLASACLMALSSSAFAGFTFNCKYYSHQREATNNWNDEYTIWLTEKTLTLNPDQNGAEKGTVAPNHVSRVDDAEVMYEGFKSLEGDGYSIEIWVTGDMLDGKKGRMTIQGRGDGHALSTFHCNPAE